MCSKLIGDIDKYVAVSKVSKKHLKLTSTSVVTVCGIPVIDDVGSAERN